MIDKNNTQYEIMTDEQRNEVGAYVPNYDELIANAPNDEMKAKWIASKELHQKLGEKDARFGGFAFNSVYMIKMACGHYEVFQHHSRDESDLIEWIEMMQDENRKCTRCICG